MGRITFLLKHHSAYSSASPRHFSWTFVPWATLSQLKIPYLDCRTNCNAGLSAMNCLFHWHLQQSLVAYTPPHPPAPLLRYIHPPTPLSVCLSESQCSQIACQVDCYEQDWICKGLAGRPIDCKLDCRTELHLIYWMFELMRETSSHLEWKYIVSKNKWQNE